MKKEELILEHTEELSDGKNLKKFTNGIEEVLFSNGAKKYKFPSQFQIVTFVNGDVK